MYWQGLIQDLTDRKRAEDSFRASEARYRMLVEEVPAVVYEMDPDDERRTLFVSPQVEALFGYSREEWLDQPDIWTELLHPTIARSSSRPTTCTTRRANRGSRSTG